VYGPVRTVVWQGSAGDRRPYADQVGLWKRIGIAPAESPATRRMLSLHTHRSSLVRVADYPRLTSARSLAREKSCCDAKPLAKRNGQAVSVSVARPSNKSVRPDEQRPYRRRFHALPADQAKTLVLLNDSVI